MEDIQLVQQAKNGDSNGVEALYRKYVDAIYRFCLRETNHDVAEAEDLTSEIFIEMAKSIRSFKGKSSFKNWLYAIAKNRIRHWIRRKKAVKVTSLFDTIIDTPLLIDPEKQQEVEKKIYKLLGKLNPRERELITLRYLRGYSLNEVAAKLGISVVNAKVISFRTIRKLRRINLDDL